MKKEPIYYIHLKWQKNKNIMSIITNYIGINKMFRVMKSQQYSVHIPSGRLCDCFKSDYYLCG